MSDDRADVTPLRPPPPPGTPPPPGAWGTFGSIDHERYVAPKPKRPGRRRRCHCGCGGPVTHLGMANGVCLTEGCHLSVLQWRSDPMWGSPS